MSANGGGGSTPGPLRHARNVLHTYNICTLIHICEVWLNQNIFYGVYKSIPILSYWSLLTLKVYYRFIRQYLPLMHSALEINQSKDLDRIGILVFKKKKT